MTHFIGNSSGEVAPADLFPMVVLSEDALALAQQTDVINIVPNQREMQAVGELTEVKLIPDITIIREFKKGYMHPILSEPKANHVPDDHPFFPVAKLVRPEVEPITAGELRRYVAAGKVWVDLTVKGNFSDLSLSYARNVEYSRGRGIFGGVAAENATDITRAVRFLSGGTINVKSPREQRIEAAAQHKPYTVTYRPGTDLQVRPQA